VGTLALASGIAWLRGKKSVYELGQDKVVEYQKLCRPKIEELLGAENYGRCCAAMSKAYDEFAPRLPILEDSNNRGVFFRNAPFILSLYRALLGEFALSQDEALDTLSQITGYKVREDYGNDPVMKFIMSRVAGSDLFRRIFMSVWERQDEEYGWATEFPESDAYIAIDVTRCGLVDWYTDSNSRFGVVSPIRTAYKPKRGDSVRVDGPREEKTGLRIGILTSLILPNEVSGYSRSGN
jgi:hypothetical protein